MLADRDAAEQLVWLERGHYDRRCNPADCSRTDWVAAGKLVAAAVAVPPSFAVVWQRLLRAAVGDRAAGASQWREYCEACKWLGYSILRLRRERNQ